MRHSWKPRKFVLRENAPHLYYYRGSKVSLHSGRVGSHTASLLQPTLALGGGGGGGGGGLGLCQVTDELILAWPYTPQYPVAWHGIMVRGNNNIALSVIQNCCYMSTFSCASYNSVLEDSASARL